MSRRSVLIVEDDAAVRSMVATMLAQSDFDAQAVSRADEALATLRERDFDAVLSDVRMPGMTGIELVREAVQLRPHTPVVLMTAFASIDSAVESMRAGALDYITKPFKRDALLVILERAFERRDLERENRRLRAALDKSASFGSLIGSSPAMREIFSLIRRVADKRSSVMITGESGTGKEKVAQTIHFAGSRSGKPFVPINCTAIPEGLLESELFGHTRGAFTGAVEAKKGLFEMADGGTLFLDEIGDMGLELQGKLLRVLEDQEIRPIGGTQSTTVDVRIIAATNRDLPQEMQAGRFRSDLFFRLNVIPLHIPPLRERPEDVRALAEFFVEKYAEGHARSISEEAMDKLTAMPWPGNVRELANAIERALALTDGESIRPDDLPVETPSPLQERDPRDFVREAIANNWTLREIEDLVIEETIEASGGNKAKAAQRLGISRRTLYRRFAGSPEESELSSDSAPPAPNPPARSE